MVQELNEGQNAGEGVFETPEPPLPQPPTETDDSQKAPPPVAEMAPREFQISFPNIEKDLCIDTRIHHDTVLLVLKVRDGPVKDWNVDNDPRVHVKHCDEIVEVNGKRGDIVEIQSALTSGVQTLTLRRPMEFEIHLNRNERADEGGAKAKIGLDIVHSAMESLLVKRVKEGMVKDWNDKNPESEVIPGDRLVAINKERGDSQRLLDIVGGQDELDILIYRSGC